MELLKKALIKKKGNWNNVTKSVLAGTIVKV
jgi:hypothetical protein